MIVARDGLPGDTCMECGSNERPIVRLEAPGYIILTTPWCILCMVERVDRVTGWRMASNVRQALMVGDAGERFHHPERFVRPPKRTKREDRLNSRAARATGIPGVIESDRADSPQESDQ